MIQRIQSVWLFLASLAIFLLFLLPYIQFADPSGIYKALKVTGVYKAAGGQAVLEQAFTGLTIGTILVGLIPLAIIFMFNNRKRQLSLCYIAIIIILAYSFWLVETAKAYVGDLDLQMQNYGIGVFLPSLSILFLVLATRGIRKDEKLVKSADRLR